MNLSEHETTHSVPFLYYLSLLFTDSIRSSVKRHINLGAYEDEEFDESDLISIEDEV